MEEKTPNWRPLVGNWDKGISLLVVAPPLGCNCNEPWGCGTSFGNKELALVLPDVAGGNSVDDSLVLT